MAGAGAVVLAYAAATALGSWTAVRHDLHSEPFGRDLLPLPAARTVALGLGGGTAIPVTVTALVALAAPRAGRARGWARTCVALGSTSLAGTLVEPAAWGRRAPGAGVRAATALNLGASVLLLGHGLRHLA
ncbi:hypothetical protein ACFVTZ_12105 [Cellulosimicrobium cellulans]|uniref:hypothetical protein n=1 Tax=Cellulosimicrobium cellulans TaxID=1710 RepID=UPI0036E49929